MKKILISGDVEGNFDFLLSKIQSFLDKNQSFDLCLCVGRTFSLDLDLTKLKKDDKKIPIPIYFIDTSEFSGVLHTLHPDGVDVLPNLTFLGKAGIKKIQGVSIAYLSGMKDDLFDQPQNPLKKYNPGYYTTQDVEAVISKAKAEYHQGVDILLTSEWPEGFDANLSEKPFTKLKTQVPAITTLAVKLKPRYHFTGLENLFYKRPPYINEDVPYVTRLITMGKIPKENNPTSQQYLFALQLKGLDIIPAEELAIKTTDTTSNPYTTGAFGINSLAQSGEKMNLETDKEKTKAAEDDSAPLKENIALYFSGFDKKTNDSDIYEFLARWGQVQDYQLFVEKGNHKGCGFVLFKNLKTTETAFRESGKYSLHGKKIIFSKANRTVTEGGKLSQQNAECWFCLDNPNVAKDLIVYIGEEFYLALDKGPINRHHVLLIPIDHHPNSLELAIKARDEMDALKVKIAERYEESFNELVIFYEKNLRVTQNIAHMIINVIPYDRKSFDSFIDGLDSKIKRLGYNTFNLKPEEKIKDMVYEGEYYVYFEAFNPASRRDEELYARRYLIIIDSKQLKNFPRDLGREVFCDIMECRNKISWKDCQITDKETLERTTELKKTLNK